VVIDAAPGCEAGPVRRFHPAVETVRYSPGRCSSPTFATSSTYQTTPFTHTKHRSLASRPRP